jgi:1-pyrroline-5-carboxylate dehydrogenase
MMTLPPYASEPLEDFTHPATRRAVDEAVKALQGRLGAQLPLRIGGQAVYPDAFIPSINPWRPDQVIAYGARGRLEDVNRAMAEAGAAFPRWSRVPARERAGLLLRAGDIFRQRKPELYALLALEVGKNFTEARGAVGESVDHFEYTARQLLVYADGKAIHPLSTEYNEYRYLPLGPGVVIAPWNFPDALPLGMILGAIAAGNTVVFKPAEDAIAIAHLLLDVLEEAGLPPGVVNLVSGYGHEVGAALVRHPDARFVAFTGSKAVGLSIAQAAATMVPGQRAIKRVMTEMGGKNAIVVADDADLAWAVGEITYAAFAFQGQKCSACSRVIAVDAVYDRLLEAVADRAAHLPVGPAEEDYPFGAVISQAALDKILRYLEIAPREGRVITGGTRLEYPGYVVAPTVVADVAPTSPLFQEEIFGPVLSFTRAESFEAAIELANRSDYALTAGLFTRDPDRIAYGKDHIRAGNLYVNRANTGAMAAVHPFGGYDMSGTGPKVGGPDYLLFFLQAQTIVERVRYPRR